MDRKAQADQLFDRADRELAKYGADTQDGALAAMTALAQVAAIREQTAVLERIAWALEGLVAKT